MPNGDPRDEYFYPTLTLMLDSYTIPFYAETSMSQLLQEVYDQFRNTEYIYLAAYFILSPRYRNF